MLGRRVVEGHRELFEQACQLFPLARVQVLQQPFFVGDVVGQHGIDEVPPLGGEGHGAQAPVAGVVFPAH